MIPRGAIIEEAERAGFSPSDAQRVADLVERVVGVEGSEGAVGGVRVGWNEDGTLDEVFGTGAFHMEQLDDGVYWFGLYRGDKRFSWNLWSRSPIEARVQDNEVGVEVPEEAEDRWGDGEEAA